MKEATVELTPFVRAMERLGGAPLDFGSPWLREIRGGALARFGALGLPGPRDEEWRQTSLAPIASLDLVRAAAPPPDAAALLARSPYARLAAPTIVLWNGRFVPGLSSLDGLPAGVRAGSLATAIRDAEPTLGSHLARIAAWEERAFSALNTALFEDGAFVTVPKGSATAVPITILHVAHAPSAPSAGFPRTLVLVGEGARAEVTEIFVGLSDGPYLSAAVSEIALADGAHATHVRVQHDARRAFHVGAVQAHQGRDSRFLSLNVSLGAALARNDVGAVLAGTGAEGTLDGLYLADGTQHVDNHTVLDHAAAHCSSHEMYKGVLAGSARAIFNGRIVVRPGAQKTDAKQSNRNLLLANDAVVHTRPQLEIYADDVKCTHGATIGHLDSESLFYLRSRGVGLADAQAVLIRAFTGSVLGAAGAGPLRAIVEEEIASRLELARGAGGA